MAAPHTIVTGFTPVAYKIQVMPLVDSDFWPPAHEHPASFCWVFKKLKVVPDPSAGDTMVVLWEQQRVPSAVQICECMRTLPPAYGGGPFKLGCACGRRYMSGRAEKEPIYIWKPIWKDDE